MGLISFFVKKTAVYAKESISEAQHQKHEELIRKSWHDISIQMQTGIDIDAIAEDYYAKYQIPDTHTILYVCSILLELAKTKDSAKVNTVLQIARDQKIDALIPPVLYLDKLNEKRTVFAVSECRAYTSSNGYNAIKGLLLLTKAYLYFFEISAKELTRKQSSIAASRVKDKFTDSAEDAIPELEYLTAGWDVLTGIHDVAKDYFDEDRIQILKSLQSSNKGFTIPLINLNTLGAFVDKSSNSYFKIEYRAGSETEPKTVYLKPLDEEAGDIDSWQEYWKTMISTVAVAEGMLLI